jgi:hypothetical protein
MKVQGPKSKPYNVALMLEKLKSDLPDNVFVFEDMGQSLFSVWDSDGKLTEEKSFFIVDHMPFRGGFVFNQTINPRCTMDELRSELNKAVQTFLTLKDQHPTPDWLEDVPYHQVESTHEWMGMKRKKE